MGEGFYGDVLGEGEREEYERAKGIGGIDDEVAILRIKLKEILEKGDIGLFMKGFELLVKAMGVKYRISRASRESLSDAMARVLREIGGSLFPEGFGGG